MKDKKKLVAKLISLTDKIEDKLLELRALKKLLPIALLALIISSCDVAVKKEQRDYKETLYNTNREYRYLYDNQEVAWHEVYSVESKINDMMADSIIGVLDTNFEKAKTILQQKRRSAKRMQDRMNEIEKQGR